MLGIMRPDSRHREHFLLHVSVCQGQGSVCTVLPDAYMQYLCISVLPHCWGALLCSRKDRRLRVTEYLRTGCAGKEGQCARARAEAWRPRTQNGAPG